MSVQGSGVEVLLHLMDPASAKQLRLCAIPHQFNPGILQVLVPNMDMDLAEERCKEFSKLSIVLSGSDGWSIHDEARRNLFAQWFKPENIAEFAAASARLVAYFDQFSVNVQGQSQENVRRRRMFHLIGVEQSKGFAEFEQLCRQARHQFRISECASLIRLVHEYDSILIPQHKVWLTYHEGKLSSDLRQWEEAEKHFKNILEDVASPPVLRVKAYVRLGYIYCEKRLWQIAIDYYQQGLQLATTKASSHDQIHHILLDLGIAFRDSGDLSQAEKMLQNSIKLAEEINDLAGMASAYNTLGTLNLKRGDTHLAIEAFEKSLEYLEKSNDVFGSAQLYNNLGIAYTDLREWEKSEQFYQKSLEITRRAGDSLGQARTLNNLARVQVNQNKIDQAIKNYTQAIRLFGEMREHYNHAVAKYNRGKIYRRIKIFKLSRQDFTEAMELFKRYGKHEEADSVLKDINTLPC